MKMNVKFSESKQSFKPGFGEVNEVSSGGGGYDIGFEEGRAEGYTVGLLEGTEKGYAQGYSACRTAIFDGCDVYDAAKNPVEQGSISSSTGGDTNSATRLRTKGFIEVKPQIAYKVSTNVERVFALQLSSAQKALASSGWQSPPYTFLAEDDCTYVRITLSNASNSAIDESAFEWMTIEEARFASD